MNLLIEIKKRSGKSYGKIAEETGLSPAVVHNAITGKNQPTMRTVQKISEALDISVGLFFVARNDTGQSDTDPKSPERVAA